jgi:hypothetical protein
MAMNKRCRSAASLEGLVKPNFSRISIMSEKANVLAECEALRQRLEENQVAGNYKVQPGRVCVHLLVEVLDWDGGSKPISVAGTPYQTWVDHVHSLCPLVEFMVCPTVDLLIDEMVMEMFRQRCAMAERPALLN